MFSSERVVGIHSADDHFGNILLVFWTRKEKYHQSMGRHLKLIFASNELDVHFRSFYG